MATDSQIRYTTGRGGLSLLRLQVASAGVQGLVLE